MSAEHEKVESADVRKVVVTTSDFNSTSKLFEPVTKTFKRRWFMLLLFVVLATISGIQWIQMSIVEDVLVDYYQVDGIWIEWTATVWSLTCMIFAIPGAWAVENYGLRPVVEGCAFLNLFGCVLKSFASGRGDFALAFVGQTVSSLCQAVMIGLPPRMASVWFGPKEVSTASSIGVLGFLTGCALGFVIPPFVIVANPDKNVTRAGIDYLNWSLTGSSAIIFICIMIWFQEKPSKPPSMASLKQAEFGDDLTFFDSLKQLVQNPGYMMLLVAYGINMGVYCAFSTLLNTFILEFYPHGQKHAGGIGLALSTTGMFGIVFSGWFLDKTKKFKEVIVANFFCGLISSVAFTWFLDSGSILAQYITGGAGGLFAASLMSIGYEVATELTYPIAEGTTNGVLSASCQVFSVVITTGAGILLPVIGSLRVLYMFGILLGNYFTYSYWALPHPKSLNSKFQHLNLNRNEISYRAHSGIGTGLVCLMPKNYGRQQANSLPLNDIKVSEANDATTNQVTSNAQLASEKVR